METVQEHYERLWKEKSGLERVQRSLSLWQTMYNSLANQIQKAEPDLTERQLRIKVFRRFYASDKNAQKLLDMAWDESFKTK